MRCAFCAYKVWLQSKEQVKMDKTRKKGNDWIVSFLRLCIQAMALQSLLLKGNHAFHQLRQGLFCGCPHIWPVVHGVPTPERHPPNISITSLLVNPPISRSSGVWRYHDPDFTGDSRAISDPFTPFALLHKTSVNHYSKRTGRMSMAKCTNSDNIFGGSSHLFPTAFL